MNAGSGFAGAIDSDEALYLYCLARPEALGSLAASGVDGERPLEVVAVGDVAALVSAVRRDEFSGEAAEARMKDLAWLGPRACRHEAVVEAAMALSPVLPARFATLFSAPERLAAWLADHRAAIASALERFAAHQEWAVKGTMDERAVDARLLATALARAPRAASAGARYLEERRIRAGIGSDVAAWLGELRQRIGGELLAHAVEVHPRAIGAKLPADEGTPFLNWASLVPCEGVDRFRERVEQLAAEHAPMGIALECSGPWPPYSFCPPLDSEPRPLAESAP